MEFLKTDNLIYIQGNNARGIVFLIYFIKYLLRLEDISASVNMEIEIKNFT